MQFFTGYNTFCVVENLELVNQELNTFNKHRTATYISTLVFCTLGKTKLIYWSTGKTA